MICKWGAVAVIVDNVHSNIQPTLVLKYRFFVICILKLLSILHQTPIVVKLECDREREEYRIQNKIPVDTGERG